MKRGTTITISFPSEDEILLAWVEGQARKKYLGLKNISKVVRKCIEIVREKNLLIEEAG